MKQLGKRMLSGIFAIVIVSSLFSASAYVQSSEYLNGYSASVTPKSKGVLVVTVDVSGVGPMTEIGASTIYMYESEDGKTFKQVKTYNSSDYPQMMGSGTTYYKDAVTYQGKVGYYYYASVYVYAANKEGSDQKNYTTAIKKAIA